MAATNAPIEIIVLRVHGRGLCNYYSLFIYDISAVRTQGIYLLPTCDICLSFPENTRLLD